MGFEVDDDTWDRLGTDARDDYFFYHRETPSTQMQLNTRNKLWRHLTARITPSAGANINQLLRYKRRWFSLGNGEYQIAADHIEQIAQLVGRDVIISRDDDSSNIESYTTDWTGNYMGGSLVCLPRTTEQVSKVMAYCNEHKIGVVPQGGNTGLVGGSVGTAAGGELILSLAKMNQILDIEEGTGILSCEAGCVLEWLNEQVNARGFVVPLDLGAKGSCMIGGNLATNAGGLRVVKYGSLQANILGLEVVQADGTVLNMLRPLRKNNCGYHLNHLFVGSEGTLGVITKVCLQLAPKPASSNVLLAKLSSFEQIESLLKVARSTLGDNLTAFEFMDRNAIAALRRAEPHLVNKVQDTVLPTPRMAEGGGSDDGSADAADAVADAVADADAEASRGVVGEVAVLIESTGSDPETDAQRLDRFVECIFEEGLVEDAVLSQSVQQEQDLWNIRENITLALGYLAKRPNPLDDGDASSSSSSSDMMMVVPTGRLFKYDLSVRLRDTEQLLHILKHMLTLGGFASVRSWRNTTTTTSSGDNTATSEDAPGLATTLLEDANLVKHLKIPAFSAVWKAVELEFCNFGHIADQNIHLNILSSINTLSPQAAAAVSASGMIEEEIWTSADGAQQVRYYSILVPGGGGDSTTIAIHPDDFAAFAPMVHVTINELVFAATLALGGSISAEHGVGQQKRAHLLRSSNSNSGDASSSDTSAATDGYMRSAAEVALMRSMKQIFDPNGILNPGKVL